MSPTERKWGSWRGGCLVLEKVRSPHAFVKREEDKRKANKVRPQLLTWNCCKTLCPAFSSKVRCQTDTTFFPLRSRMACSGFFCIWLGQPVGSRWFCLYLPGISEKEKGEWGGGIEDTTAEFFTGLISLLQVAIIHSFIYSFCSPPGRKTLGNLKPWRVLKGQVKQNWKTLLWPLGEGRERRRERKREIKDEYEWRMCESG